LKSLLYFFESLSGHRTDAKNTVADRWNRNS
jgi:hypothetical protein